MAANLKRALKNLLWLTGCMVCFTGEPLAAEQLTDPTRPAIGLVPGLSGEAYGANQGAPAPDLQSVIISRKHEAAIINGTEVGVGEKYGDAVLTLVNETCVVLMGPQGRQVMHMFPTVNMSKDELACVKRQTLQPISKPANKAKKITKAKSVKRAVICAPDETKNGSGK